MIETIPEMKARYEKQIAELQGQIDRLTLDLEMERRARARAEAMYPPITLEEARQDFANLRARTP